MSSDIAIRAEGLGKKYLIGHAAAGERYVALRDVIARNVQNLKRSAGSLLSGRAMPLGDKTEEFWALKDVDFDIKRGDVVGIIGRNGAGKSTLLKILSRITEPSEGRVEIHGRVASLLEVGTGFHPELSGRDNIFLNGAILGMTRAEILSRFDEIVAFAEVERFLDTPVKRYSSGMYVRLAFAVAAHLEPEILVVDEVLAVGDMEFQKKCIRKMETIGGGGSTVLFVSHNLGMISSLCNYGIYLENGAVACSGPISMVMDSYLAAAKGDSQQRFARPTHDDVPVWITAASTTDLDAQPKVEFGHIESVALKVTLSHDCRSEDALSKVYLTVVLLDSTARKVFQTQTKILSGFSESHDIIAEMEIPPGLLTEGHYSFILSVNIPPSTRLHRVEEVCHFAIIDVGSEFSHFKGGDIGCVTVPCTWRVEPEL